MADKQQQQFEKPEQSTSQPPPPPAYGTNSKPAGSATQSAWDANPYAFAPNTNTMDAASMPSKEAEAARQKAAEVMAALRSGEPGASDRAMGKAPVDRQGQMFPLRWLGHKARGESWGGEVSK